MEDQTRGGKRTKTITTSVKSIIRMEDNDPIRSDQSEKPENSLLPGDQINLIPNALICVLLFIAFIILGAIAINTVDAIESYPVGLTMLLLLIGLISAAAGAWMIYFNRNPGNGILIFLGYYVIIAIMPGFFVTGFYMYYYECYNAGDYLKAIKDDTEYWNSKYGEEKTVEQATERAYEAIWHQGAANIVVGAIILLTLIPFGKKIQDLNALRVLTYVLVIPLSLTACALTTFSFIMMNLYADK